MVCPSCNIIGKILLKVNGICSECYEKKPRLSKIEEQLKVISELEEKERLAKEAEKVRIAKEAEFLNNQWLET